MALGGTRFLRRSANAIHAKLRGGSVDQPLDGESDFRPAGAAISIGRHGVGEHGDRAQGRRRNRVGAGNEAGAFAQRRQRHAARADIADIGGAHGDEAMLLVERQFDLGHQIAALIIAEEGFRARRGEFHRPADFSRRPQHQAELDKDAVARAEIAADVVGQHAHSFPAERRGWSTARSSAAPRRRSRHRACSGRSRHRNGRARRAARAARR